MIVTATVTSLMAARESPSLGQPNPPYPKGVLYSTGIMNRSRRRAGKVVMKYTG